MNKLAHGVILIFLGAACFFTWGILQLPAMIRVHGIAAQMPGFTLFCVKVGPAVLTGLAALATGYCLWVWFRKTEKQGSWVGFLATATASVFLVTLPVIVAIYLPIISVIGSLPAK